MNIRESAGTYESWLRVQLMGEVVEDDLDQKHENMGEDAFRFLRATYWRWAETILNICPGLDDAPEMLAVGDIHIENYGTWRDYEGRLVWGVNDFDEAAVMPYIFDVVRLATSGVLRPDSTTSFDETCAAILGGYRKGLAKPKAIVLDRDIPWLQAYLEAAKDTRETFWEKFDPKKNLAKTRKAGKPPLGFVEALATARPDTSVELSYWPRIAGGGSLGRPRWVGYGLGRGAPIVREAKAMVPSGWVRAGGRGPLRLRCLEIATGRYRSPDPWLSMRDTILVRRLSPSNSKLELDKPGKAAKQITPRILELMGRDLASVHLGTPGRAKAIDHDLHKRGSTEWFARAVEAAAKFVKDEQKEWQDTRPEEPHPKKKKERGKPSSEKSDH
jgi:hypothetical protein